MFNRKIESLLSYFRDFKKKMSSFCFIQAAVGLAFSLAGDAAKILQKKLTKRVCSCPSGKYTIETCSSEALLILITLKNGIIYHIFVGNDKEHQILFYKKEFNGKTTECGVEKLENEPTDAIIINKVVKHAIQNNYI